MGSPPPVPRPQVVPPPCTGPGRHWHRDQDRDQGLSPLMALGAGASPRLRRNNNAKYLVENSFVNKPYQDVILIEYWTFILRDCKDIWWTSYFQSFCAIVGVWFEKSLSTMDNGARPDVADLSDNFVSRALVCTGVCSHVITGPRAVKWEHSSMTR